MASISVRCKYAFGWEIHQFLKVSIHYDFLLVRVLQRLYSRNRLFVALQKYYWTDYYALSTRITECRSLPFWYRCIDQGVLCRHARCSSIQFPRCHLHCVPLLCCQHWAFVHRGQALVVWRRRRMCNYSSFRFRLRFDPLSSRRVPRTKVFSVTFRSRHDFVSPFLDCHLDSLNRRAIQVSVIHFLHTVVVKVSTCDAFVYRQQNQFQAVIVPFV